MDIFREDPIIGFTYEPNSETYEKGREYNAHYKINSLGLRDREYPSREDGVFRVLLVGDSFSVSHGLPIEESLSRQLENSFQAQFNSDNIPLRAEVINSAHGGYSPYNYWKAYQKWEPLFKPDAVVVGISPDDFDCTNADSRYMIENGETIALYRNGQVPSRLRNSGLFRARKWLAGKSEFYILLRNFFYYNDIIGRINLWMGARSGNENSQIQQFMVPQPESINEAWKKSFSYLKKLKEDANADGVQVILIPIPLKFEIDNKEFEYTLAASHLDPSQVDIDQPLKQVLSFAKKENLPVFNPRQTLRGRHPEKRCYFVYDGHWIAEGIRVSTEFIVSQWKLSKLPPWDIEADK